MKSSGNVSQTPAIGLSHALSDVIKRFISSRFQNWFKVVTVLQTVKKNGVYRYYVSSRVVLNETMALLNYQGTPLHAWRSNEALNQSNFVD